MGLPPIGLDVKKIIRMKTKHHIYDEECMSCYYPSDVFNIHPNPAQHRHRQMALCAARPDTAQVFLTSEAVTQECDCSCVLFQLISAPLERFLRSILELTEGRRGSLPNE